MDREGVVALLVGVLGAVCMALLAIGPVYYMMRNGASGFTGGGSGGEEDVKASMEADAVAYDARAQEIAASGLNQRYTVIPFHRDLANALYRQQDFAKVEAELAERYALHDDPYQAHLYARLINLISRFEGNPPPEQMGQALDAWVEAMPQSYRARLVRALFHSRLGLEYREVGASSMLRSAAWEKFESEFALARADLEAASALNSGDAEIPVNRGATAMYLGEGREQINKFYQEAIALNPTCLSARVGLAMAAAPTWGGSWEQVDDVIAECETASRDFPLVLVAKREAEQWMWSRSKAYAERNKSREKKREWVEPYLNQLKRNPNDAMLIANVAYFAANAGDFVLADQHFRMLGDKFPEGTNFKDLLEYNNYRGNACAASANKMPVGPERMDRAKEALDIAPDHYYTNYIYGVELVVACNVDSGVMHLERSRQLNPDYLLSTYRLAEIAEQTGRRAEALSLARELLAKDPDDDIRTGAQKLVDRNR